MLYTSLKERERERRFILIPDLRSGLKFTDWLSSRLCAVCLTEIQQMEAAINPTRKSFVQTPFFFFFAAAAEEV